MPAASFHPIGATEADEKVLRVTAPDSRLTQTHYFDGRLLTAHDLTRDQVYLDQRLLDLGRAGGDGIVSGLGLSPADASGTLRVGAGLGVTPSGRIVGLERELEVDLGDRAQIELLNAGTGSHLDAGAYAIVLVHAEFPSTTVAEIFPTDLGVERGATSDAIAEGAEVVLVRLPVALPAGLRHAARAELADALIGASGTLDLPPEGVVLGVLAVRNDAAQWVDAHLLRHALRRADDVGQLEDDLRRHYEDLLEEVRSHRENTGLTGAYAASQYVHRLPAFGRAPKPSFDPVAGTFEYFPRSYAVTISVVRADELRVIAEEARLLDPFDVTEERESEVLVLARLGAADFARFAPRLEKDSGERALPFLDALRLRWRHPRTDGLDTDAAAWKEIWSVVGDQDVYYVRRAPRAATTPPSGILLSHGAGAPGAPGAAELAELAGQLDERTRELAELRTRVDAQDDELGELREERTGMNEAAEKLREQLDEARSDVEEQKETVEEQLERIAELERLIEKLKQQLDDSETDRETERTRSTRLEADMVLSRTRIEELESDNNRRATEMRTLARRTALLNRRIIELGGTPI